MAQSRAQQYTYSQDRGETKLCQKQAFLSASTYDAEGPKVLLVLSMALERLIRRNEQDSRSCASLVSRFQYGNIRRNRAKPTLFHALSPPNISVQRYLERIYKYTKCSPSCFVVGYAFMDRLVHRQPHQPITSLNVHRLLITSIMLAAKTLDDMHHNNAFYAKVGGISTCELNMLELDLLFQLDFKVTVTLHTFESYCSHLERDFIIHGHHHMPIHKTLPATFDLDDSLYSKDMTTS